MTRTRPWRSPRRPMGMRGLADVMECLARLATGEGKQQHAARLFGVTDAIGSAPVRFASRSTNGGMTHPSARAVMRWGTATSTPPGPKGRRNRRKRPSPTLSAAGERKRPTSGWESLTPTEHDVVRLVSEGLGNKDIATRLFISPRTVQTRLTHVYAKLGFTPAYNSSKKQRVTPDLRRACAVWSELSAAAARAACSQPTRIYNTAGQLRVDHFCVIPRPAVQQPATGLRTDAPDLLEEQGDIP